MAISATGSVLAQLTIERTHRSIVWLQNRSARPRTIMQLPNTVQQVITAAVDGPWAVFAVGDQPILDSFWTMYVWNSESGLAPTVLYRATQPGVDPQTVIAGGHAFWTATVSATSSELHMTDLATRRDKVIRSGVPGEPFLYDSRVVWTEMAPGVNNPITFNAADPRTGQLLNVPPELTMTLRRPAFANGGGEAFVWIDDHLTALHVFRQGKAFDVLIGREGLQWPTVSGNLITLNLGSPMVVADLRTQSFAKITQGGGYVKASQGYIVIASPAPGSNKTGSLEVRVIPTASLPPLPACSG